MPSASGAALITATVTDSTGMTDEYSQVVTIDTCAVNCAPDVPVINPPADGATVSGTISVTVTATDNEDIPPTTPLTVEISFDDGATWLPAVHTGGADTTYIYSWNTTSVPNGPYTIQVRATDSGGLTTPGLPVTVTVNNIVNAKPTVTIDVPGNGDTVDGTFDITVTATDDSTAQADLIVEISIDGGGWIAIGHAGGTTYTYNWNTTLIADGTHTIAARATDDGSPALQSDVFGPITVTVKNNYAPHVVAITSPGNGTSVPKGTVTIQIAAEDDHTAPADLVVQVSIDGGAYQSATYTGSGTAYTYSWDTTSLSGLYTITARATDTGNPPLSTTSSAITLTVVDATTMHISAMTIAVNWPGGKVSNWEAIVTITVVDDTGSPVAGVTVTGNWEIYNGGSVGRSSCSAPTDASGQCTVSVGGIPINKDFRFLMTALGGFPDGDITGGTLTYNAADNVVNEVNQAGPK